jgi:hypothetical protein
MQQMQQIQQQQQPGAGGMSPQGWSGGASSQYAQPFMH